MSSIFTLRFCKGQRVFWMISCLFCSVLTPFLTKKAMSQENPIAVRGKFWKELSLSLTDLEGMPLSPTDGFAMSVTGEDSTGGRSVKRIKKIEVH